MTYVQNRIHPLLEHLSMTDARMRFCSSGTILKASQMPLAITRRRVIMKNDLLFEVIGQADAQTLQKAVGAGVRVSVFAHANLGDYTLRLQALETAAVPSEIDLVRSLEHIGLSVIAARHGIARVA